MIKVKRVYDAPESGDGFRILVDRLWPRGLSKDKADVDLWLKDVAPSDELRKWFGHDPEKWVEFQRAYWTELDTKKEQVDTIRQKAKGHTVTLLFSAHDAEHNNAIALKGYLEAKRPKVRFKPAAAW